MRNKFAELLYEAAISDDRIYVVVADISPAGSMAKFRDEFPKRFINVGVAEQSMIGISAGLAREGAIPFVYTISAFSLIRPFEFIRDDIVLQNLNVNIVGIGSGLVYSTLGPTHHTIEDVGLMSLLPGMEIYSPADKNEMEYVMHVRLTENIKRGPAYLRLGKAGENQVTNKKVEETDMVGNLRYLSTREEADVLIVSYGLLTSRAVDVSQSLKEIYNINSLVASMPKLSPIEWEKIRHEFLKFKLICVLEEHLDFGSIGMQISTFIADNNLNCRVLRVNLGAKYVKDYGNYLEVLDAVGLSVPNISEQIRRKLGS